MAGITLKHAYEQGSLRIAFACNNYPCRQSGKMDILDAIRRWGGDQRMKEIRAWCSLCGSSENVSIMGEPPGRLGKRGNR